VVWVESILAELTERDLDYWIRRIENIASSPNTKTKRVKGWKENIRRIRRGNERLLIHVGKDDRITVLTLLPKKEAYSKQTERIISQMTKAINCQ
jgi:mRNA-degrading endonuclease RelE of RelBE toxin-antitoxin system